MENNKQTAPIFIQGIWVRSGTNYLWRLLLMHDDCHVGSVGEDFLLKYAHLLWSYSENVYRHWTPKWRKRMGGSPNSLLEHVGQSLVSFIKLPWYYYPDEEVEDRIEKIPIQNIKKSRLVTKTPNVNNLSYFFQLFPEANLIIIVRDGRSVVESAMKTFGRGFEYSVRQWATGARKIIAFDKEQKKSNQRYAIVKYEDVYTDTEKELRKIFSVLNLDPGHIDYDAARNLPIFGSSELQQAEGQMHWKPVEKKKKFDPIKRWRNWDDQMHDRFNWIAGDVMEMFGYTLKPTKKTFVLHKAKNIMFDAKHRLNVKLGIK